MEELCCEDFGPILHCTTTGSAMVGMAVSEKERKKEKP